MSIVGTAAASSLSKAVAAMRRADEERITNEHRAKANERGRRYRERKRERERRLKLPKPDTPLSLTSLLCEQDGEPVPAPARTAAELARGRAGALRRLSVRAWS
jgi:hypothetical protein